MPQRRWPRLLWRMARKPSGVSSGAQTGRAGLVWLPDASRRHRARHLGLAHGVSGGGAERRRRHPHRNRHRTPRAKSRVPVSPLRQAQVRRAQPGDLEGAPRVSSICAARQAAAAWPGHRIPRARKPPVGSSSRPLVWRAPKHKTHGPLLSGWEPRGAPASVRAKLWHPGARWPRHVPRCHVQPQAQLGTHARC